MTDSSGFPEPRRVGVRQLRENLTRYLAEAGEGRPVLVTSRNKVIAEIRAPATDVPLRREPGSLRGRIHMAEDFDRLPDEVLQAIEE